MKYARAALVAVFAVTAASCASSPSPVRLLADPVAMSALVGDWQGVYSSVQTGRSGSIVFNLRSTADTAYGDVVMTPKKGSRPVVATDRPAPGPVAPAINQVLTIRFVRVEGNRVAGILDPYDDPDCACRLHTTFIGLFDGQSRIEGTFESRGSMDHPLSTGKWEVARVRR
jgi:hypothetical protein